MTARSPQVQESERVEGKPGDCPGCGAEYPHCDCAYLADEDGAADAREGMYTAWEIIDG